MRIAIVNDSIMAVETLRRAVTSAPDYQIAWISYNGADAIQRCVSDLPDLILMDLIMPGTDGVEATRRIMSETPCPILIVTSTVTGNSVQVFEALGAGALDAVNTPIMQSNGTVAASGLLYKIATLAQLKGPSLEAPLLDGAKSIPPREQLIALGASAGGPAALAKILSDLPRNLPVSVVIVQHLDAQFAPGLASWLESQCSWPVRVIRDGDSPEVGTVLVAGTNDHLVLQPNGKFAYTPEPLSHSYRPSIDVFFETVQRNWKGKVAAALLTGMGRDGAQGMKTLRASGALTITQSREGCVVYGMPKAAVELDAATQVLPLEQIASALAIHFSNLRASG